MQKYTKHKKSRTRKQLNENNDCAVITLAIVMRTTYKVIHAHCANVGRKVRGRTQTHHIMAVIETAGFSIERIKKDRQKSGSKFTPKTIGDKCKRGYYMCFCNGHVFAVVNGIVEDWTNNRQHHINAIYKVTRNRK